jgi:predicted amidophosphoribosyltransferase
MLSSRRAALTQPSPCPRGFPRTATAGPYDELLRSLVSAHKERPTLSLTVPLAGQLTAAVRLLLDTASPGRRICLVPVPSAGSTVRERGFDAAWALARRTARTLRDSDGLDVVATKALAQRRGVLDQSGLDAGARRRNLAGRLRMARRPPPGYGVVVVDDVVTTGSTLTEASRVLGEHQIILVGAATVASTVRLR